MLFVIMVLVQLLASHLAGILSHIGDYQSWIYTLTFDPHSLMNFLVTYYHGGKDRLAICHLEFLEDFLDVLDLIYEYSFILLRYLDNH